jgi:hypothetical protein
MKILARLFLLPLIAFVLVSGTGCATSHRVKLNEPLRLVLSEEISWDVRQVIGTIITIRIKSGSYIAIERDDEGYYFEPDSGKYIESKNGKDTEVLGGLYFPIDTQKGLNVYFVMDDVTMSLNGALVSREMGEDKVRLGLWSSPALRSSIAKNIK